MWFLVNLADLQWSILPCRWLICSGRQTYSLVIWQSVSLDSFISLLISCRLCTSPPALMLTSILLLRSKKIAVMKTWPRKLGAHDIEVDQFSSAVYPGNCQQEMQSIYQAQMSMTDFDNECSQPKILQSLPTQNYSIVIDDMF